MDKKKVRKSYTGDFKVMVVEDMLSNKLSYRETCRKHGIVNHHVPQNWERTYLTFGAEYLRAGTLRPPQLGAQVPHDKDILAENHRLHMENAYLKKYNALAQEKAASQQKKKPRSSMS